MNCFLVLRKGECRASLSMAQKVFWQEVSDEQECQPIRIDVDRHSGLLTHLPRQLTASPVPMSKGSITSIKRNLRLARYFPGLVCHCGGVCAVEWGGTGMGSLDDRYLQDVQPLGSVASWAAESTHLSHFKWPCLSLRCWAEITLTPFGNHWPHCFLP